MYDIPILVSEVTSRHDGILATLEA